MAAPDVTMMWDREDLYQEFEEINTHTEGTPKYCFGKGKERQLDLKPKVGRGNCLSVSSSLGTIAIATTKGVTIFTEVAHAATKAQLDAENSATEEGFVATNATLAYLVEEEGAGNASPYHSIAFSIANGADEVAYSKCGRILAVRTQTAVSLYLQTFKKDDATGKQVLAGVARIIQFPTTGAGLFWAYERMTQARRLALPGPDGVKVLDIHPADFSVTVSSTPPTMKHVTAVGWHDSGAQFLAGTVNGDICLFTPGVGFDPNNKDTINSTGEREFRMVHSMPLKDGYLSVDIENPEGHEVVHWPPPPRSERPHMVTGLSWLDNSRFAVCHTGTALQARLEEDVPKGEDPDEEVEVVLQTTTIVEFTADFTLISLVVAGHANRRKITGDMYGRQFFCRIPCWDYYSKWRTDRNPMTDTLVDKIKRSALGPAEVYGPGILLMMDSTAPRMPVWVLSRRGQTDAQGTNVGRWAPSYNTQYAATAGSPVAGMDLDFSGVRRYKLKGQNDRDNTLPSSPRLYLVDRDGVLTTFDVFNADHNDDVLADCAAPVVPQEGLVVDRNRQEWNRYVFMTDPEMVARGRLEQIPPHLEAKSPASAAKQSPPPKASPPPKLGPLKTSPSTKPTNPPPPATAAATAPAKVPTKSIFGDKAKFGGGTLGKARPSGTPPTAAPATTVSQPSRPAQPKVTAPLAAPSTPPKEEEEDDDDDEESEEEEDDDDEGALLANIRHLEKLKKEAALALERAELEAAQLAAEEALAAEKELAAQDDRRFVDAIKQRAGQYSAKAEELEAKMLEFGKFMEGLEMPAAATTDTVGEQLNKRIEETAAVVAHLEKVAAKCEAHLDKAGKRKDTPGLEQLVLRAQGMLPAAYARQRQVEHLQRLFGDGSDERPPNRAHQEYLRQRPLNPEDAKLMRELLNERDVVSQSLKMAQTHVDNAVAWLYNAPGSARSAQSEAEQLAELGTLRKNLVELRAQQQSKVALLKSRRIGLLSRGGGGASGALGVSLHHHRSVHDTTISAPPSAIYAGLRGRLESSFSQGSGGDTTQILNQSRARGSDRGAGRGARGTARPDEPNTHKDKYAAVHADRSSSTPKHRALRVKKAPEYVVTTTYPRPKKALGSAEMAAGGKQPGPQPRVPLLVLTKGTRIVVTAKANNGWWEAQNGEETGLVRNTYLRPLFDKQPASSKDWVAQENTVLSLREGDKVTVNTQDTHTDWWEVSCDGACGWFPKQFLRRPPDISRSQTRNLGNVSEAATRRLSTVPTPIGTPKTSTPKTPLAPAAAPAATTGAKPATTGGAKPAITGGAKPAITGGVKPATGGVKPTAGLKPFAADKMQSAAKPGGTTTAPTTGTAKPATSKGIFFTKQADRFQTGTKPDTPTPKANTPPTSKVGDVKPTKLFQSAADSKPKPAAAATAAKPKSAGRAILIDSDDDSDIDSVLSTLDAKTAAAAVATPTAPAPAAATPERAPKPTAAPASAGQTTPTATNRTAIPQSQVQQPTAKPPAAKPWGGVKGSPANRSPAAATAQSPPVSNEIEIQIEADETGSYGIKFYDDPKRGLLIGRGKTSKCVGIMNHDRNNVGLEVLAINNVEVTTKADATGFAKSLNKQPFVVRVRTLQPPKAAVGAKPNAFAKGQSARPTTSFAQPAQGQAKSGFGGGAKGFGSGAKGFPTSGGVKPAARTGFGAQQKSPTAASAVGFGQRGGFGAGASRPAVNVAASSGFGAVKPAGSGSGFAKVAGGGGGGFAALAQGNARGTGFGKR